MTAYRFILDKDFSIQTDIKGIFFHSDWLTIQKDGYMTIKKDYAWNGCSPKGNLLDITWGTPDGRLNMQTGKPLTYYASLVHDALYQYKGQHGVTRKQADDLFLAMLLSVDFKLATVYYMAVRLFGWTLGKWKE